MGQFGEHSNRWVSFVSTSGSISESVKGPDITSTRKTNLLQFYLNCCRTRVTSVVTVQFGAGTITWQQAHERQ